MRRYLVAGLLTAAVLWPGMVTAETAKDGQMQVADGSVVAIDYTLTVDGDVVDSSDGQEPLTYTQGQHQIISGLEKELAGMKVGEEKTVTVSADEGYGAINPDAVRQVPKSEFPADMNVQPGMMIGMQSPDGQRIPVRVKEVTDDFVLLDMNHPLAGKDLQFQVKVVSIH